MILSTNEDQKHVADGDLIRLRDGECSYAEERDLRNHLELCETCWENANRIEYLADGFFAGMEEIKPPFVAPAPDRGRRLRSGIWQPPRRTDPWHRRRVVRVAAIVVAVFGLCLTTAPARALVAAGWQALVTLFAGAPTPEIETQQASSLVSFVPRGEEFLIDFVHVQSAGTLSLVVDTATAASARVFGGDGRDEMIVLQAGLRVRNRTESVASYELRLPRSLLDIEVRVAGVTVAALSTRALTSGARWEVDLARPGGSAGEGGMGNGEASQPHRNTGVENVG